MDEVKDPYYSFPECSNSDLSWLKSLNEPEDLRHDKEKAYRFGTLLDCCLTEPHKVNYFRFTCAGNQYTREEFRLVEKMKAAFWADPYCNMLATHSNFQSINRCQNFTITFNGITITVPFRIKWDLDAWDTIDQGGDIKSTTAKTYAEFVAACHHFEYFRQRAVYMDVRQQLTGRPINTDMLIGVSKVNCQVFKVPIIRGGDFYLEGYQQYTELGFKYFTLFPTSIAA